MNAKERITAYGRNESSYIVYCTTVTQVGAWVISFSDPNSPGSTYRLEIINIYNSK